VAVKPKRSRESLSIAYIGGGSRGWAWKLMSDLALEPALSGVIRLYDIDREAAEENALIGSRLHQDPRCVSRWRYETVPDLQSALEGADFVVLSILPGTFREMQADVHLPEEYGIFQPVGDTTGPGGLLRALRTVPIYQGFARAIQESCPRAWVINYTNPMAVCLRTLYKTFPAIKAFGCCHEVFGTQDLLAAAASEMMPDITVERQDLDTAVTGLNHFTWITSASYKDVDLMPLFTEFAEQNWQEGWGTWEHSVFASAQRVKFDLHLRYGLIAAGGDRHLAEFCPKSWYLADAEAPAAWKFHLTSVDYRVRVRREINNLRQRVIAGTEKFPLKASGEEGVAQMKALLGMAPLRTNINLPNRGQVPELQPGTIVETQARLSRDSIQPEQATAVPWPLAGWLQLHAANQEAAVEAAERRDTQQAFQALLQDPLVDLAPADAEEMFHRMLEATKAYLPGWHW